MRKLFFVRLSAQNIGKNRRFFIPYLLAGTFTIAMLYDLLFLLGNEGFSGLPGKEVLGELLGLGVWIIRIFSAVFLFYTNSFLMKHRKKELGLYNVLGMTKSNLAHLLFWESVISAAIALSAGIFFGILFSKLFLLIFCRLIQVGIPLGFEVPPEAVGSTLVTFLAVYTVIMLYNFICIRHTGAAELLKGGNVGEREPKAKWLFALVGFFALAAGYAIALTVDNPLSAIMLFFLAVLLVILGTYLLFMTGSIAVLKLLKKKKSFYYKPRHFTAVSGMLYRMKQNAAGLASICILSTMVLVTLSGTVCLYAGAIGGYTGSDLTISFPVVQEGEQRAVKDVVSQAVARSGRTVKGERELVSLEFTVVRQKNRFSLRENSALFPVNGLCMLSIISDEQYSALMSKKITLRDGEALAFFLKGKGGFSSAEICGKDYAVTWVDAIPRSERLASVGTDVLCLAVNREQLAALNDKQTSVYGDNASVLRQEINLQLDGSEEDKIACYEAVNQTLMQEELSAFCNSGPEQRFSYYCLFGGLFFIGSFLGLLFIGFTALIIFYKQISEGYEDKRRFEVMRKVGMSEEEIRKTIRSQVLTVFFLPLGAAVLHLCAAYRIIHLLLALFNGIRTELFPVCLLGTVLIFAVLYFFIYRFTAKTYLKIIGTK